MKIRPHFMLLAVGALFAACGPLDEPPGTPGVGGGALTAEESSTIHGALLSRVNDALQSADAVVSEQYGCAPQGSLSISGTRQGSSVDRTYDVRVTASNCWIVSVDATSGERRELVLGGGPATVAKDATGGVTASGRLDWAASGGRGGTCTLMNGQCL